MSFAAYCEKAHINKKKAQDIKPDEQSNIFYCLNTKCSCQFTVAALHSNKVRVHFVKLPSSEHTEGCWNDVTLSESGYIDDYNTLDFSPAALLDDVTKTNFKHTPSTKDKPTNPKIQNTTKEEILYIHTIRQLFTICLTNDNDDEINGVKIKDIFAGRKTSYFYTKYISGIKLVECSYHSYDSDKNIIRFHFPYNKKNFILTVHFNTDILYKKIIHSAYNYKQPILIYADWDYNETEITSKKQIVFLK